MTQGCFRFDRFQLDIADRRLTRDGAPVEVNARYFDALALLVRDAGKLVSKDRFLEEVWRGVPVTDEALTQCIKSLRRQLGDEAARPRFIETIPKHGYRFIADVRAETDVSQPQSIPDAKPAIAQGVPAPAAPGPARRLLLLGAAGTVGAGFAGVIGGLAYGFIAASEPIGAGAGSVSVLLVLLWLAIAVAVMGGGGVSFGIAAPAARGGHVNGWSIAGGALGGLLVGATVKLLGLDAFNLLLGQTPGEITGAPEGAMLGAGAGLGAWLASRRPAGLRLRILYAATAGGAAGLLIALAGGRLLGGSLLSLASTFPHSRLQLDSIGRLFGETGFGPVSRAVTSTVEGSLFAIGIVAAMMRARRRVETVSDPAHG